MKTLVVTLLIATAVTSSAREPTNYDSLRREMAIMEDVFESTLRVTLDRQVRISGIEVDYLAEQGVVIALDASRPFMASTDISEYNGIEVLTQIPSMVEEILHDVEIYVAPYDPDELQELRALRDDQRRLRTEQRSLRGKLRDLRRRHAREEDEDDRDELASRIENYEQELEALDREYDALDEDIDDAYARVRDVRTRHEERVTTRETESFDVLEDALIAAVCDYGPTVKSLDDDEHLTVVVRQRRGSTYYVFRQSDVVACQRESISHADLKAQGYIY